MTRRQLGIVGVLMAACVAIGILLASNWNGTPFGFAGPDDVKLGAAAAPVTPSNEVSALNDAFVAVSKAVTPQVVSITVTSKASTVSNSEDDDEMDGDPFRFFRRYQMPETPTRGAGSGVILSPDGYIITNNHVVEEGTGSIKVQLTDGREFTAKLIGKDSLTDLAVIKIEASDLPVAAIGNSDEVQVGQIVLAVGNPLGLSNTVTQGIVSAIGRGQLNLNAQGYGIEDFIQTDAAINPGNSGGGLFNMKGELVGINSAIASRTGYYQGYGFAIPISLARAVIEDLIEDGKVNRGYIGVQIKNIDPKLAKALGIAQGQGVLVADVVSGGAAESAGVKPNDVILEVDGQKVNTSNHLQSVVARRRAGQSVNLKVYRDGSTFERAVTLKPRDERENSGTPRQRLRSEGGGEDGESLTFPELGMDVRPMDPQTRRDRKVESGVVISRVVPYSEARDQGILPGDVVQSVNRKPVTSPEEFKQIIDNAASGDVLLMQLRRTGGSTDLVAIEVKK